jgi:hypothetical protein
VKDLSRAVHGLNISLELPVIRGVLGLVKVAENFFMTVCVWFYDDDDRVRRDSVRVRRSSVEGAAWLSQKRVGLLYGRP